MQSRRVPGTLPNMAPDSQKNKWSSLLIIVFIAIQIALPLSYYLGDNAFDERFAWRMFSPVRMARCQVKVFDATSGAEEELRLGRRMHIVWINLLKRARPAVVEKVAAKFCDEARATNLSPDIRMMLTCTPPDAVLLGVCADKRDANGDGIPDGYSASRVCDDPGACFQADCGDDDIETCYRSRCRVDVVPRHRNLCNGGA